MKEHSLSVIARCPDTGDLGAAVISSFPAIGAYTPFIKKGAGIIAVQGWFYPELSKKGLTYLEQGMTANLTLDKLLTFPDGSRENPMAVLDAYGNGAAYTGVETEGVSSHLIGKQYAIQGQGLLDEELLYRMKETFEQTSGELAVRILETMKTIDSGKEGGCTHFRSAILAVARDPVIPFLNIRVDGHPHPVVELISVYQQHQEKLRRRFLKSLGEKGMVT